MSALGEIFRGVSGRFLIVLTREYQQRKYSLALYISPILRGSQPLLGGLTLSGSELYFRVSDTEKSVGEDEKRVPSHYRS
jgi:hypothetical protein